MKEMKYLLPVGDSGNGPQVSECIRRSSPDALVVAFFGADFATRAVSSTVIYERDGDTRETKKNAI
jgi:hypothetical protein